MYTPTCTQTPLPPPHTHREKPILSFKHFLSEWTIKTWTASFFLLPLWSTFRFRRYAFLPLSHSHSSVPYFAKIHFSCFPSHSCSRFSLLHTKQLLCVTNDLVVEPMTKHISCADDLVDRMLNLKHLCFTWWLQLEACCVFILSCCFLHFIK